MLFSIAYNMLGSLADAEDMVQETFASWISTDKSHVENPKFYLIRTVSNKCINHLKKLKQERELYNGTWLPEPLIVHPDAEMDLVNKNNLTIGFMFLLEKLSPIERGILILKESFDMEYLEISKIFDINYETSRQHLSRARKKLQLAKSRFNVDTNTHNLILNKFLDACLTGDFDQLIKLLREDVVMYADGGGKAPATLRPISGMEKVIKTITAIIKKTHPIPFVEIQSIKGLSGILLYLEEGKSMPDALITIDIDDTSRICNLYFIVNPEKLEHLKR